MDTAGDPEVGELDQAGVVDHHVGRLDVPVRDTGIVGRHQGRADRHSDGRGLSGGRSRSCSASVGLMLRGMLIF